MIEIARLHKRKALLQCALMLAACAFILSLPVSTPGGLTALLENRDGYRGYWPIAALAAVVLIPTMVVYAVKIARWPSPAVFIMDGHVHGFGWKSPVPLTDVDHVLLARPEPLSFSQGEPFLVLKTGKRIRLPHNHEGQSHAVLRRLAEVLHIPVIEPPAR